MKKSNIIKLVLVSATLAACNHPKTQRDQRVYMRSDTTANYTQTHGNGSHYGGFYVFRPYGLFMGNGYYRAGYYSGGIHEGSNIGSSSFKSATVRGGFGGSAFHVSS